MGKVKATHVPQGEVLVEIKDICKTYMMDDEVVHASDHLDLTIRMGEFVAIVGKSGSGKSTLMSIIGVLDVPISGACLLGGKGVGDMTQNESTDIRNRMIGFIFQQCNLLPRLNPLENVELPLLCVRIPGDERKERALQQLERVGLKEKAKNTPNQLSGGQQQHVSIARALAGDSSLLLTDEPTGALSSKISRQIFDLFQELHRKDNTIIMIAHDNSIAMRAKRVMRIQDEKISFDRKAEEYTTVI